MRKAHAIILAGLGAVASTGAVAAASQNSHILSWPLPDGSIAKIEYVGSVAPKVAVTPGPGLTASPITPFGLFDRAFFDMDRQFDAMMRQVSEMTRQPAAGALGLDLASYENAPAGTTNVTVVSTSDGTQTCTRRTEVTAQGPGKAPKVVSTVSGDCEGTQAAGKTQRPTT
jgi:hypothetical protein